MLEAHCVFNLKIHLVFIVAYRRRVILESILTQMEEIFKEVCQDYNAELREFSGESDHVHLLVAISPTVRISDLVRTLKSVSSRKIRQEFSQQIRYYLWGKKFWTRSYCVISVGDGASTQVIES
ncbi:IS200/IS605 family transposase [Turicimonas muris]|uniref:IS200/IS605 family transposase n=2 Tax=Turicimonas muris TaxID=1796652 RepID=UPI001ECF3985|nr:IS200/IS605 family transposase [Turicimonas muris]MBS4846157.1 IS200/IS605 family transposase [Burkholderiales bacterium]